MGLSRILMVAFGALFSLSWSIPASGLFFEVTQPDGSTVEVRNRGNEHSHFKETRTGQVVKRDSTGFFRPGKQDTANHFVPSDSSRYDSAPAALAKGPSISSPYTYRAKPTVGNVNILVVLVQFQDTKFISSDANSAIGRIIFEEGYSDNSSVGSVADYYKENSLEKFNPQFDVVGPVTVSGSNYKTYGTYSRYGDYGAQMALGEALDTLKKQGQIDFKKYDNDGDGFLDYVHMVYAGFGAHDSPQDSAIWPHRWIFQSPKNLGSWFNGLYVEDYSCNAERDWTSYYYDKRSKALFGVGNFIHEFSHLMGLPDMYATNGDTNIYSPSRWDIMDLGAYNTLNRKGPIGTTPPYFSAYERMALGWMTPTKLSKNVSDTLQGVQNNIARQIKNPRDTNEYFLLEYREGVRWDMGLPNRGLLIWHIDFDKTIWESATINNTEHQHIDIEEADGIEGDESAGGDVFPGAFKMRSFDKFITWNNEDLGYKLTDIAITSDLKCLTFDVTGEPDQDTIPEESEVSSSSSKFSSEEGDDGISAENPNFYVVQNSIRPNVTVGNNRIHLSYLPKGEKTIQIFSLNGNLLYSKSTWNQEIEIGLPRQQVAFLLRITQGRHTLFSGRIQ
ncbi:MAG: M6 family metalloprotease domain-containing protein [Fibrobacter sp.]|nr:M6 family metalloprotease domain-containing protein [Fibrobacter sp.]